MPDGFSDRLVLLDAAIVFADGSDRVAEIVERDTRRVFSDAAGWRLVEHNTGCPGHLLLSHHPPDGGTMLARLDPATGEVIYLGRVPARLSGCRAIDGGLVCLGSSRQLEFWRWR